MEITGYQVIVSQTNKWGEILHSIGGFYQTEEEAQIEVDEYERLYPYASTVIIPLIFNLTITPIN